MIGRLKKVKWTPTFGKLGWYFEILTVVLLTGYGLRMYQISEKSLSHNEGYWLALASMPQEKYWGDVQKGKITASLYPEILREWYQMGHVVNKIFWSERKSRGIEKFTMRLPWSSTSWEWNIVPDIFWGRFFSVLWGLMTIGMLFCIGREMGNFWIGMVSCLLLAMSPTHIRVSREITPGSLELFIWLCILFCYLRMSRGLWGRGGNRGSENNKFLVWGISFILFSLTSVLIHSTTIIFLFLLLAVTVGIGFTRTIERTILGRIYLVEGTVVIGILLYKLFFWKSGIWVYESECRFGIVSGWKEFLLALGFSDSLVKLPDQVEIFGIVILIIALFVGVYFHLRNIKREQEELGISGKIYPWLVALWIGMMLLFFFGQSVIGMHSCEDWLWYEVPIFSLVVGSGLYWIPSISWRYRILVLILLLDWSYQIPLYQEMADFSWRDMAVVVNHKVNDGDRVVVLPAAYTSAFDYYFQQMGFRSWGEKGYENAKRVWLIKLSTNWTDLPGSENARVIRTLNQEYPDQSLEYFGIQPGIKDYHSTVCVFLCSQDTSI